MTQRGQRLPKLSADHHTEALGGLDRRISVLEDWRAFLHNHAVFEHPSDPLNDRYIIPVHNDAGAESLSASQHDRHASSHNPDPVHCVAM